MGSKKKKELHTLTGVPAKALNNKTDGHFQLRAQPWRDEPDSVALIFAGGDLEIVFYQGQPVVFRRRTHVYHDRDRRNYYGEPLAYNVIALGAEPGQGLPSEEFRLRLIDNMIIALKRTMSAHDVVADSAELTGVITKSMEELFDIARLQTDDAEHVKERVLDARMRMFTRLMGLDKQRKQDE